MARSRWLGVGLTLSILSVAGAGRARASRACALIETDDDVPSGSATAGALYVGEDELGRRLLTSDVLSVATGFRDAGWTCIVVADSHERALDHARLTAAGLRVITPSDPAWRWPFFGVAGPEIRIAALVGFHTRAGAPGFRPHTVNDYVKRVTIGGTETGEVGIAMLGLSAVGASPVLVVGDEGAAAEARAFSAHTRTVVVRWHDAQGAVRFLSEGAAPSVIRRAAREAAVHSAPLLAWRFPLPLVVEAKRPAAAGEAARAAAPSLARLRRRLAGDAGDPTFTPEVGRGAITWTSKDARAAYLSLVAVASSLQPPHWSEAHEWITRGFQAYRAGRNADALAAYRKALELDPLDEETRCRLAQVHLATGAVDDALAELREADRHLDEMGDRMRQVCRRSLAQALQSTSQGRAGVAREAQPLTTP